MTYNLDKFFNFSLDMLCIAGLDGYFKLLNPSFERTLGWSNEELLAKPFVDFIHPDDVVSTLLEVEKLAQGELVIAFENRYRCKNDSFRHFLWTAYPEKETGLIYSVARDITDRKIIEQAREQKLLSTLKDLEKLQGLVPLCSHCKSVRSDEGYWSKLELFLSENTGSQFTHSICPQCTEKHYGEYLKEQKIIQ